MFNLLHSFANQELFKNTSAIKVATMKITEDSIIKRSRHVLPPNQHLSLSAKMNRTQNIGGH